MEAFLANLTSIQLSKWQVFNRENPIDGFERLENMLAVVCSLIVQCAGGKYVEPSKFLPDYSEPKSADDTLTEWLTMQAAKPK